MPHPLWRSTKQYLPSSTSPSNKKKHCKKKQVWTPHTVKKTGGLEDRGTLGMCIIFSTLFRVNFGIELIIVIISLHSQHSIILTKIHEEAHPQFLQIRQRLNHWVQVHSSSDWNIDGPNPVQGRQISLHCASGRRSEYVKNQANHNEEVMHRRRIKLYLLIYTVSQDRSNWSSEWTVAKMEWRCHVWHLPICYSSQDNMRLR